MIIQKFCLIQSPILVKENFLLFERIAFLSLLIKCSLIAYSRRPREVEKDGPEKDSGKSLIIFGLAILTLLES